MICIGVMTGDIEDMVLKSVTSDDLYRRCSGDMEVMVLKSMISDDLYRSYDWRH